MSGRRDQVSRFSGLSMGSDYFHMEHLPVFRMSRLEGSSDIEKTAYGLQAASSIELIRQEKRLYKARGIFILVSVECLLTSRACICSQVIPICWKTPSQLIIFLPLASSLYSPRSLIQVATPSVHSSDTTSHLPSFAAFLTRVELIPTPSSASTISILSPHAGSKPAASCVPFLRSCRYLACSSLVPNSRDDSSLTSVGRCVTRSLWPASKKGLRAESGGSYWG